MKQSDPNMLLGYYDYSGAHPISDHRYYNDFKENIYKYENEKKNGDIILQILLKIGILKETYHIQGFITKTWNTTKIKETYPEETLLLPILKQMIEKFRDDNIDTINKIVAILKEFDNENNDEFICF